MSGQTRASTATLPASSDRGVSWSWPRSRWTGPQVQRWGPFAVPLVAGLAGVGMLAGADPRAISSFGLVTVATPWLLVPLAVLVAGFVATLVRAPARSAVLACYLVAWTVLLHGAPAVVEDEARFPVAWLHVGFVDQILREGEFLPQIDARFSWPGFFAAAAGFSEATGVSPLSLLRWAPVVIELAVVVPLAVLIRTLGLPTTAAWVAAWVFVTWDWVGQNYFAPQAVASYLLLVIVAAVARWLPRRPVPLLRWPARWSLPRGRHAILKAPAHASAFTTGPSAAAPLTSAQQLGVLVVVLVMSIALVMTHQLTPVVLAALLAVFVLAGWRPLTLPLFVGLAVLAWLTWMAAPFWTGHLGAVFGAFGQIGDVVQEGVVGRFHGDASRQVVLVVRVLFAASGFALAALGAWRLWRVRGRFPWVLGWLTVAPFALVAVQSYGGEVILRVVMYSLPAVAALAAAAFVPGPRLTRRAAIALASTLLAVVPVFGIARYGNEAFEQVRSGEVSAVRRLFEVAEPGASIVAVTPLLPWRFERYAAYQYVIADLEVFADAHTPSIAAGLPYNPQGTYLVVTAGQIAQAEIYYGLGAGWGDRLQTALDTSSAFEVVARNQDAVIYRLEGHREP